MPPFELELLFMAEFDRILLVSVLPTDHKRVDPSTTPISGVLDLVHVSTFSVVVVQDAYLGGHRKYPEMWDTSLGIIENSSIWHIESLFHFMPYPLELPKHSKAKKQIILKLCDTCERRAVALFSALQFLLPIPLIAIYMTTICDMSLFLLIFMRHFVDGSVSSLLTGSVAKPMSANGLVILGILLHVVQVAHFYTKPALVSSPYGFCSNIFVLLITGFTSYSIWVTLLVCLAKNFLITVLYLSLQVSLTEVQLEYFYTYWSSCGIVLCVLYPIYFETLGRITAEEQASAYKTHMDDLLRASFDACVWVDSALRIAETEPKLDCLFSRKMLRRSLLDHVAASDRVRFEGYMSDTIRRGSTSLFHTSFVTSASEMFHADVYITSSQACYWLGKGEYHQHLLGIRASGLIKMDSAATNSWECQECHCMNHSDPVTQACVLCGSTAYRE